MFTILLVPLKVISPLDVIFPHDSVPVNVGAVDKTTEPVPVDVVTPVPPFATARVPLDIFVAFRAVKPVPTPVRPVEDKVKRFTPPVAKPIVLAAARYIPVDVSPTHDIPGAETESFELINKFTAEPNVTSLLNNVAPVTVIVPAMDVPVLFTVSRLVPPVVNPIELAATRYIPVFALALQVNPGASLESVPD